MASILGDGTGPGGPGPSRCLLLLQRSLAIQLIRGSPPHVTNAGQRESPKEHPADEMWMYDKGYNLFQVSRVIFVYVIGHLFVASPGARFRRHTIDAFGLSVNSHRPVFPALRGFCPLASEKFNGSENVGATTLRRERLRSDSSCPLLCSLFVSTRGARVLYGKANVDCPHRYATMRQCELRAISQKSA